MYLNPNISRYSGANLHDLDMHTLLVAIYSKIVSESTCTGTVIYKNKDTLSYMYM